MRLHLDTNNATGSTDAAGSGAALSSAGKSAGVGSSSVAGLSSSPDSVGRDKVAVSGASSAWAASFSDRAARVSQLTAAVQGGTYRVPSAAISQAIVANAASAAGADA